MTFISLTKLGVLFGVSSHKVGQWLIDIGLRTEEMTPSRTAFDGEYVQQAPTGRGTGYYYVWNSENTIAALEKSGHRRIDVEASDHIQHPSVTGPFRARSNDAGRYEIVDANGYVSVWCLGGRLASQLAAIMTLADGCGKLK